MGQQYHSRPFIVSPQSHHDTSTEFDHVQTIVHCPQFIEDSEFQSRPNTQHKMETSRPIRPSMIIVQKWPRSGMPFNPNDLTQRLMPILIEQRRREAREERERRYEEAIKFKAADDKRRRAERAEKALSEKENATFRTGIGSGSLPEAQQQESTASSKEPRKRRSLLVWRRSSNIQLGSATQRDDIELSTVHYVPQEAAKQFARTTTPNKARASLVPKLSLTALKYHQLGDQDIRVDHPNLAPNEQAKALKRARSARELNHGRNQFQWPAKLREVSEAEELHPRHCFSAEFLHQENGDFSGAEGGNRQSSRSVLEDVEESENWDPEVAAEKKHRTDWTQRDEDKGSRSRKADLLKRVDSIWTLKRRSGGSTGSNEKSDLSSGTEHTTLVSPRHSLFSRFRR